MLLSCLHRGQVTSNIKNTVMEQKIIDVEATVLNLNISNSVLMANQEEMTTIYKHGGVPSKITTFGGGAILIAPGPGLAGCIEQIIEEKIRKQESSNSSKTASGDTNNNVVLKKDWGEIT